jgi:hypothetical protein
VSATYAMRLRSTATPLGKLKRASVALPFRKPGSAALSEVERDDIRRQEKRGEREQRRHPSPPDTDNGKREAVATQFTSLSTATARRACSDGDERGRVAPAG